MATHQYVQGSLSSPPPPSLFIEPHQYRLEADLAITIGGQSDLIEFAVLGCVPTGKGDEIILSWLDSLKKHPQYVLEEHEHSALISPPNEKSPAAVYKIAVNDEPLTWHRHPSCAFRFITLTTGSAGAIARFSPATDQNLEENKKMLLSEMIEVLLPPDSQISLRFNGHTYHQFAPLKPGHPAFCAISVHPNEREEITEVNDQGWHSDLRFPQEGSIPRLSRYVKFLEQ